MTNNLGCSNEKMESVASCSFANAYEMHNEYLKGVAKKINRKIAALIRWRLRSIGIKCDNLNGVQFVSKNIVSDSGIEGVEICIIDSKLGERWICDIFNDRTLPFNYFENTKSSDCKVSVTQSFFYR